MAKERGSGMAKGHIRPNDRKRHHTGSKVFGWRAVGAAIRREREKMSARGR